MGAPPGAIAVLGMHRSGTSCLTGLLEDAGVYLGDVQRQNPHNALGNRESLAIVKLHDAVLAEHGASWDHPPDGPVRWSDPRRAELREIAAGYRGRDPWAFKDPRALFTLDGWRVELPALALVGTFRHPVAVARSLAQRSGMALGDGLALWVRYNRRLLDLQGRFGFDLVGFDLPREIYLSRAAAAFARLGVRVDASRLRFFREDLRRQSAPDPGEPLPDDVGALYRRLQHLGGEAP